MRFPIERRWPSAPKNVYHARRTARAVMERCGVPDADLLELAVAEACANAIVHGSPDGPTNHFTLRCFLSPERAALVFEVSDEGRGFARSWNQAGQEPDLVSSHGRGMFLIEHIADEVALKPSASGLCIRITKHFPTARSC